MLCHLSGFCCVAAGSPSRSGMITDGLAVEAVPGSTAPGRCPLFLLSAFSGRLPVTPPVLPGSADSLSAWRHALFLPLFPRGFHKQLDCSVCLFLLPVPTLHEWIKVISLLGSWRGGFTYRETVLAAGQRSWVGRLCSARKRCRRGLGTDGGVWQCSLLRCTGCKGKHAQKRRKYGRSRSGSAGNHVRA